MVQLISLFANLTKPTGGTSTTIWTLTLDSNRFLATKKVADQQQWVCLSWSYTMQFTATKVIIQERHIQSKFKIIKHGCRSILIRANNQSDKE